MTRGDPYGSTILSDRGPFPKGAGDRLSELGHSIVVVPDDGASISAGDAVQLDGDGGATFVDATNDTASADGIAANDWEPNASSPDDPDEALTVHLFGVVRSNADPTAGPFADGLTLVDDVDGEAVFALK